MYISKMKKIKKKILLRINTDYLVTCNYSVLRNAINIQVNMTHVYGF